MEKTLNELGIYHFRQLKKLGPDQVKWVAEHINTFSDRIERDRWVEQAGELDESGE